jgi:DNA-binding transcriptional ArsR family regulator
VLTYKDWTTALGDPTRVRVFELLREGPASVAEIAGRLPVSRPAVSQHLRVLLDAGLVRYTRDGTRHVYGIDPTGVAMLWRWLDTFSGVLPSGETHPAADSPAGLTGPPDVPGKVKRSKKKRRGKKKRQKEP